MNQLNDLIVKLARQPEGITDDDVERLRRAAADCPAQVFAPMALLKFCPGRLSDDERDGYRRRIAMLAGNRDDIINFIDPTGSGFADFYPRRPHVSKPATESAIDTFLDTYGHRSPEEDALLERMIFNPVPDYSEQLARSEGPVATAAAGTQDSLIDAFLAANPADMPGLPDPVDTQPTPPATPAEPAPRRPEEPAADGLLSESLAKIFIKQGRYDRAYEIISNLNLNYPEKSVYFADQLRFLRKLIINQSHAQQ